jgi:hypothetical protein
LSDLLLAIQRAKEEREQRAILERALAESQPLERAAGPRTPGGDRAALRGLPVIVRGVSGTSPGTDPLEHLLWKERQAKRKK